MKALTLLRQQMPAQTNVMLNNLRSGEETAHECWQGWGMVISGSLETVSRKVISGVSPSPWFPDKTICK